jgi:hypothetical protein
MTKQEIMSKAHRVARQWSRKGFSYSATFTFALRMVWGEVKEAAAKRAAALDGLKIAREAGKPAHVSGYALVVAGFNKWLGGNGATRYYFNDLAGDRCYAVVTNRLGDVEFFSNARTKRDQKSDIAAMAAAYKAAMAA